jgi:hypothetical protein
VDRKCLEREVKSICFSLLMTESKINHGIFCNYLEKGNHGHFFFFFLFFLYVRRIRVDYNFLIFFPGFEIF